MWASISGTTVIYHVRRLFYKLYRFFANKAFLLLLAITAGVGIAQSLFILHHEEITLIELPFLCLFRIINDFGFCCQIFLLIFILFTVIFKKAWLYYVPASILFTFVYLYLLFDLGLYAFTSYRFDTAFFVFLKTPIEFLGTARWYELMTAFFFLTLTLFLVFISCRFFLKLFKCRNLNSKHFFCLLFFSVVPFSINLGLPELYSERFNNVALREQVKLFHENFNLFDSHEMHGKKLAVPYADFQNEIYERISAKYPLMKRTKGFTGEKNFEVEIDKNNLPHVIIILVESFRSLNLVNVGFQYPQIGKCFNELTKEGVLFTDFYSNGTHSPRSLVATLCGLQPLYKSRTIQNHFYDMQLKSLPEIFKEIGYQTIYAQGCNTKFAQKIVFMDRLGFDERYGLSHIKEKNNLNYSAWGAYDEDLYSFYLDRLMESDKKGKKVFSVLFTVSSHVPFTVPNKFIPSIKDDGSSNKFRTHYMQTLEYADFTLGNFISNLKKHKLYDKSLIIILGDHGWGTYEHTCKTNMAKGLYGEFVWVPCLLLAPGRLKKSVIVDEVASQVDIIPTLLDIFGIRTLNNATGRSLMRKNKKANAYFNCPIGKKQMGMKQGKYKLIYKEFTGKVELYDISKDKRERNNLAKLYPEIAERMKAEVIMLNHYMTGLYMQDRIFDDKYGIHEKAQIKSSSTPETSRKPAICQK